MMLPRFSSTAWPVSATVCVTSPEASALPSVSNSAVLPRKSANRTVRSRIWVIGLGRGKV